MSVSTKENKDLLVTIFCEQLVNIIPNINELDEKEARDAFTDIDTIIIRYVSLT